MPSSFLRQLLVLQKKNWQLRWRTCCGCALWVEIIFPPLFMLCFGLLRYAFSLVDIPPTWPNSQAVPSLSSLYAIPPPSSYYDPGGYCSSLFFCCDGARTLTDINNTLSGDTNVTSCYRTYLATYPLGATSGVAVAELANYLREYLMANTAYPAAALQSAIVELTEDDLATRFEHPTRSPPLHAAIGLNADGDEWDYSLRINTSLYSDDVFQPLQLAMQAFARQATPDSTLPSVSVGGFPTASSWLDTFWLTASFAFGLCVSLAIMSTVTFALQQIVTEKERKIREALMIMSLRRSTIYLSWLFTFLTSDALIAVLMYLASFHFLFQYSQAIIIIVYFYLFLASAFCFAFFVTSFFNRARTAQIVGSLAWFGCTFVCLVLQIMAQIGASPSMPVLRALSLLPVVAFSNAAQVFQELEGKFTTGVRFDTLFYETASGWTMADSLGMLFLDCILYFVLGVYFDHIIPGPQGVSHKPWFFVLPSYWCESKQTDDEATSPSPSPYGSMEGVDNPTTPLTSRSEDAVVEAVSADLQAQENDKRTITTQQLRKEFGNVNGKVCGFKGTKKVAVQCLDLTLYEGHITALLGHNGAGKTTTINMLTGMMPTTEGTAFVRGKDIRYDMAQIRKEIGFCPQHNILWDHLTVMQHLTIYADIKGLPKDRVQPECEALAAAVGLSDKLNVNSKALSGGMKRKLSLAIAMLGDDCKVMLLDEPTSGMDPWSRRSTWDVIKRHREGRIIILTTHFMDEADLLGDRIAIMSEGRLVCCGSSLFLKEKYGIGYSLTVVLGQASDANQRAVVTALQGIVQQHVHVEEPQVSGREVTFRLPTSQSECFAALLRALAEHATLATHAHATTTTTTTTTSNPVTIESKKGEGEGEGEGEGASTNESKTEAATEEAEIPERFIADIGVSVTTLEEVFLRVGAAEEDEEGREVAEPATTDPDHAVVRRHLHALMRKRGMFCLRDFQSWCCQLVLPLLLLGGGLALYTALPYLAIPTASPPVPLNTSTFNTQQGVGYDPSSRLTLPIPYTTAFNRTARGSGGHEASWWMDEMTQHSEYPSTPVWASDSVDTVVLRDGDGYVQMLAPGYQSYTGNGGNPYWLTRLALSNYILRSSTKSDYETDSYATLKGWEAVSPSTQQTDCAGGQSYQYRYSVEVPFVGAISVTSPFTDTRLFSDEDFHSLSGDWLMYIGKAQLFARTNCVGSTFDVNSLSSKLPPSTKAVGVGCAMHDPLGNYQFGAVLVKYPSGSPSPLGLCLCSTQPVFPCDCNSLQLTTEYRCGTAVIGCAEVYGGKCGYASKASRYGGFAFNTIPGVNSSDASQDFGKSTETSGGGFDITILTNDTVFFSAKVYQQIPAVYVNVFGNALLTAMHSGTVDDAFSRRKTSLPLPKRLHVTQHKFPPPPLTEPAKQIISATSGLMLTIVFTVALTVIPPSFVLFVVREKQNKQRHQQRVSGLNTFVYWLSNLLWDLSTFLSILIITAILFAAFKVPGFTENGENFAVFLLSLFLFALATVPFVYLFTFMFTRATCAWLLVTFITILTGVMLIVVDFILQNTLTDKSSLVYLNYFLFRLFPPYNIGKTVLKITVAGLFAGSSAPNPDGDESIWSWNSSVCGMVYMGSEFVVYSALVLLIETRVLCALCTFAKRRVRERGFSRPDPSWDGDVQAEHLRLITDGIEGDSEDPAAPPCNDLIQVRDVHKHYGAKKAVQGITFGIDTGTCFGLLGVNGAGKTTTFAMMTGEFSPTHGTITIDGFDVVKNTSSVQRRIGFCPQFDALWAKLTAREHLRLYGQIKGVPGAKLEAEVDSILYRMGLTNFADKLAGGFSGGNKRKLSVGIALIGSPKIVFLDEPSTGMDPKARRQMWDIISKVTTGDKSCCTILTTHSMEECESLCTRICIMADGQLRCIGSGTHLKSRFGKSFTLEAVLLLPSESDISSLQTRLASALAMGIQPAPGSPSSPETFAVILTRANATEALRKVLDEAQVKEMFPLFYATALSPNGAFAGLRDSMSAREAAVWICERERKFQMKDFVAQTFPGASLKEELFNTLRYSIPVADGDGQDRHQQLARMFEILEANKDRLSVANYAVGVMSLEEIFNEFAKPAEHRDKTAIATATVTPPTPPPPTVVRIQVTEGMKAGQTVQATLPDGTVVKAQVPEGVTPGNFFEITVQTK